MKKKKEYKNLVELKKKILQPDLSFLTDFFNLWLSFAHLPRILNAYYLS